MAQRYRPESGFNTIKRPHFICRSPVMIDPLAEVIALMRPRAVFSKVISGAGAWAVRYSAFGQPSFCTMLEGECVLAVDQQAPVQLAAGDFVLMPATSSIGMTTAPCGE